MSNIAIADDYLTPGTFVKINFGQGRSNAGGGSRDALFFGPMTASGATATANTKYEVTSEAQAKTLFGAKSPLWWMIRSYFKAWQGGTLHVIPYAASSGGGGLVTASTTISFVNTATASGTVTIRMFGEERVIGFVSGASVTQIALDVAEAINGMDWPVTASPSVGVVTVSAPIGGASQNSIYRITGTISFGATTTCTVAASTLGSGADGTTTELSNLTSALAAALAEPDYYLGLAYKQTSSVNSALKTHIVAKITANLSNRCRGFVAGSDSKATLQAAAIAVNYELMQLIGEPSSEYDPAYLVGQVVGWIQAQESLRPQANMTSGANLGGANWHIQPIKDISVRMAGTDINDLMIDGVTAIRNIGNTSLLNASLTTASKDATGLINDRRKWSSHVISIAHECAARMEKRTAVTYQGFNLKDDTYDGTTLTTKRKKLVLTPSQFKLDIMRGIIEQMDDEGMLDHVDDVIIPSFDAGIDTMNANRLEATLNLRCIAILMQTAVEINEVTPG